MTINYNETVSTSRPWTFFKLLFRWKGSIWKAVYLELLLFLLIYGIISAIYRCALNETHQEIFEAVVRYFDAQLAYIPLELVLGFFCTQVFYRWNKQYDSVGFIDNSTWRIRKNRFSYRFILNEFIFFIIGLMCALYVRGRSQRARMYRRNIVRYCELVQVLVFRDVSMRVRRRFPSLDTIVAAGFMLPHEKELFQSYDDSAHTPKYWIPANWALSMTYQAWKHGHIESPYFKVTLQEEIRKWRTDLEWVFNYDWVPLPLMYPQVVCLAVHLYFLVCILARQKIVIEHEFDNEIDFYFPIMTALQFVFYMGWMKVIEDVINPFGEDDDDFETNALIDRNITMGMMMVDQGYDRPPEVRRDPFWEGTHPLYSEETSRIPNHIQHGSVSQVKLASSTSEIVMMPHSRIGNRSAPALSTEASVRKSVRVRNTDRDTPRQSQNEPMIYRLILTALKRIHHCISSLLPSLKRARTKEEEKPPIVILATIPVEPPTIDEIILGTDTRPISIAIPTESPVYSEKFVFNIKQ